MQQEINCEAQVIAWARQYSSVSTLEIRWDREIATKRFDTGKFETFHFPELFRARWPNQWLVVTGESRPEIEPPSDPQAFAQASFGKAGGRCIAAFQSGEGKYFQTQSYCGTLDSSQLLIMQGGPVLLGRWLWDLREDLSGFKFINKTAETCEVEIKSPVRCRIEFRFSPEPARSFIQKMNFTNSSSTTIYSIAYENYKLIEPPGIYVPTRVVTDLLHEQSSNPETRAIPSVRTDLLTGIKLNGQLADNELEVSLVGFREAGKHERGKPGDQRTEPPQTGLRAEVSSSRRTIWALTGMVVILCLVVAGLVIRGRSPRVS